MNQYLADLHVHTVLSPCGCLEMSPLNIVAKAKEKKLDILGITDHNSTLHCALMQKLGTENGIFVLMGVEVTTREEVHCLAYFESYQALTEFQAYIDRHLPFIKNNPALFGHQVVVDQDENILEEIDKLLIVAINQSINQVQEKVCELGGLFVPAHIDRARFGIISQLGFFPSDLQVNAIEINKIDFIKTFREQNPSLGQISIVNNSDAHHPDNIGAGHSYFEILHPSFHEIKMAFHGQNNRKVFIA